MPGIGKRTKTARESIQICGSKNTTSQLRLVYRRHAACVYTLCLRLLVDVGSAEGATVDAFARFNQILERWQDESRTSACLRELAIEAALARLHEHNAATEPTQSGAELLSTAPANGGRATRLDPVKLERLIACLPDHLRVPYVLCDVEGLSDTDIATRLRLDKTDVRWRVHHARLELRRFWLG